VTVSTFKDITADGDVYEKLTIIYGTPSVRLARQTEKRGTGSLHVKGAGTNAVKGAPSEGREMITGGVAT
jgi:hypothetical protein